MVWKGGEEQYFIRWSISVHVMWLGEISGSYGDKYEDNFSGMLRRVVS
jgi:hypothetical protein